ncbi:flagellar assembly protein T N-terminal domain-containing protein [Neptunicella sp. SCSIO 80796]|uniref:flagellar assembly protein T N-terminal domain-containing protein n=1 Tax=Neptunicella plasticusilytica TaxID=3117012 RepID=UPI003A4D8550
MRITILLLLLLIAVTANCLAAENWYQGEAHMLIGDAPLDEVREKTIKNAIADASFQAGAMISSEEILLNGLLVNSKVVFRSQGVIRRAEVLSESIDDGVLTVRVEVDIHHGRDCVEAKYTKNILVTQFQLLKPKQAAIGGLFNLAKHVSKRLEQQLDSQPDKSSVILLDEAFTTLDLLNGLDRTEVAQKSSYLRREYGHQFVLFGVIRDISVFNRVKKKTFSDDVTTRRNFTIRIYLLDVYHNKIVFEDSYHAETDWPFAVNEQVDTNSSIFWQSDYGRAVLNTLSTAIVDIDDIVSCSTLYGQIMQKADEGYVINFGRRHGVEVGDTFILSKILSNINNGWASSVMIRDVPDSQVQVIAVDEETSLVASRTINAFDAANLFDLVRPIKFPVNQ